MPSTQASETPRSAIHFGVNVRAGSKYGLRIERESYAVINKRSSTRFPRERAPELWDALDHIYEDEDHRLYTDAWCEEQQAQALENYDLNMAYFRSLDPQEFDDAISKAVASRRGMVEVKDLNKWDGEQGLYVMVLDQYKQAYVGVSNSLGGIKARIRQHWSTNKAFDRLLWGRVDDSILSIDSFRALDTTRIFASKVRDPLSLEDKVIQSLPSKFVLNRIMGGDARLAGLALALGSDAIKRRPLAGVDDE